MASDHETPDHPAKLIPKVYDDIASPSAKAVGNTLESAVKTALRPADALVWTIDRAFDWVAKAVTTRFESDGVTQEQICEPSPDLKAQVVLGLQTAGPAEDPTLRELFCSLLTRSMKRSTTTETHPGFALVLRQIIPIEARMFAWLAGEPSAPHLVLITATYSGSPSQTIGHTFLPHSNFVKECGLGLFSHREILYANLERLGIIRINRRVVGKASPYELNRNIFEEIENQRKEISRFLSDSDAVQPKFLFANVTEIELTAWGHALAEACDAANHQIQSTSNSHV